MTFTEDWFCTASQEAIAELVRSVAHLDGDIIEVGSWEGRSTAVLANVAAPQTVHAVDTWQGSPGEISATLASQRDVHATFLANMKELTDGNVVAHRMGWRDFFDGRTDPVKFIHIDAEHTYAEVFDNIQAVRPLIVPGGIICGDDVHHPPVQWAAYEALRDVRMMASLWVWRAPS